jgi:large subunit ribosomal protein L16
MFIVSKVKHRKWHKGRRRGVGLASRATEVSFGSLGLKAMGYTWMSARQLEAARRVLIRYLKKGGKMWVRVFPDKPVTKKGNEVPMGGGKGSVDHFVVAVKPGVVLFEIDGIGEALAKEALTLAGHKLPIKTIIVPRFP